MQFSSWVSVLFFFSVVSCNQQFLHHSDETQNELVYSWMKIILKKFFGFKPSTGCQVYSTSRVVM